MSTTISSDFGRTLATQLVRPPAGAPAAPAVVLQTGTLAFSKSSSTNYDATAQFSDLGLDSATNKLAVSLDLKANQKYNFSFYFPSGGPKVTLTDAKGKKTDISMAKGFSVAKSGTYTLSFAAGYSLKDAANFNNLALNAKSVLASSTGNAKIDALLYGGTNQWWHDWDATAVASTEKVAGATVLAAGSAKSNLTYSFLSAQPVGQSMSGFQAMTSAQKDAVRRAFDYYAKILNVTFTEVQGDNAGDINFGTNTQASSAGYANPPGSSGVKDKAYMFLANNQASNSDAGMQEGNYGYLTVLHEIGHTLGLKHPGNYNAGGGGTPAPYLPSAEDNRQYSIMAYTDNARTRGVTPSTAMLYDVAALQSLYGANKSGTTAVNGAFTFADGQNTVRTVWSASGSDAFDLSALKNSSNVNLNAGAYSSINIIGSTSSSVYSGNQNVAIAYGSKINSVTLSSTAGVAESVTLNNAYASGQYDTIASFDASVDKIALKKSFFGTLTAGALEFGASATKKTTRIVVNQTTGEVFYDADGKGKAAAKKIAQYTAIAGGNTNLSASNFSFVA